MCAPLPLLLTVASYREGLLTIFNVTHNQKVNVKEIKPISLSVRAKNAGFQLPKSTSWFCRVTCGPLIWSWSLWRGLSPSLQASWSVPCSKICHGQLSPTPLSWCHFFLSVTVSHSGFNKKCPVWICFGTNLSMVVFSSYPDIFEQCLPKLTCPLLPSNISIHPLCTQEKSLETVLIWRPQRVGGGEEVSKKQMK